MIKVSVENCTTNNDSLEFYALGLSFVRVDKTKTNLVATFVITYREAVRLNHFLDTHKLNLGCNVNVDFDDAKTDADDCFLHLSTPIEDDDEEDTLPNLLFTKEVNDYRKELKEVFGIELASEDSIKNLRNREKCDVNTLVSEYNNLMVFKELNLSKDLMQEFMHLCADNCVYPKVEKAGNRYHLTI